MTDAKIRITAKDDTSSAFKTAVNNVNGLKASASGLVDSFAALAGGIGVAGGLLAFAKSALDSIDALNDLKDATGASIENISALEDVAARTGTKFDTVGAALIKFNGILNSANPDSGAAAALQAIGLEADNLKALDPAEALRQTAVALSRFADDGNKARIVQELFGKSIKDVAPFLTDLATQGKLVATVTTQQAEEAEKFNKELAVMQKNITDVSREMAGSLATAINATISRFREGAKEGKSFWQVAFPSNAEMIARFDAAQSAGKPYAGEWNEPDTSANNESAAESARLGRKPSVIAPPPKPDKPPKPPRPTGGAPRQSEADRYLETLQRQFERTQDLSTVDQLLLDIQKGRLGQVSNGTQAQLLRLAEQLDGVKAQTEAEKRLAEAIKETSAAQEDFFASVMKSDDAKQNQIASLLNDTPTANLEKQRSDVQLLTAEFEAGRISESLYLEAVSSRLDLAAEKMTATKTLAEDLNMTFTSAFEDAIVGGKSFSEVLQGLEQDIIRIITRKMVTEPLGNALSGAMGGAGGLGGLISGLFSADGGGYTGNGPRSGGVDGKGGFMAILHPQETVVDHTRGQSMGKTNNVNLVVNQSFASNTSRATTMQAASDARRQLEYAGRNL